MHTAGITMAAGLEPAIPAAARGGWGHAAVRLGRGIPWFDTPLADVIRIPVVPGWAWISWKPNCLAVLPRRSWIDTGLV